MPPLRQVRVPVKVEMKTPWWFKVMLTFGIIGTLILFCLLVWGVVEIVPALVRWLDRNSA